MEKLSGSTVVTGILAVKCHNEQSESQEVAGGPLVFLSFFYQVWQSIVIQRQEFIQGSNFSFVFGVAINSKFQYTTLRWS